MFSFHSIAICAYALTSITSSQPTDDLITNLPGMTWNVDYKMYSGFLDLSNGHHLHYWFTESQNNPIEDPIVLWLNGGPGCSSMDGLFYEQGPIHVNNTDNTLYPNRWAWNLNASLIFLESPICVGFSYTDDNKCVANDNTTADDNYHALLQFFNKFPMYVPNDFFVMGESYAGVYVPTTTKRIMVGNVNEESNITINLKAFAVGDPVGFDGANYINSGMWYNYFHGWISQHDWNNALKQCCDPPYTHDTCHFGDPPNTQCAKTVAAASIDTSDGSINVYDWIEDCYRHNLNSNNNQYTRAINTIWNRLKRNNKYLNDAINELIGDNVNEQVNVICINSNGAYNYLNRKDVRKAINIPSSLDNTEWNICSDTLKYESLDMYDNENWLYQSMWEMDDKLYTMVYNGDADPGINFLVSQWFVDNFSQPIVRNYREWFIEYDNNGGQVGGWTMDYEKISFVTIRGAGHMVPQFRPPEALKMFESFIRHKPLE